METRPTTMGDSRSDIRPFLGQKEGQHFVRKPPCDTGRQGRSNIETVRRCAKKRPNT